MEGLPPEALAQVASYFQALSEPTRLQILNLLREGERNVGEIAQQCGFVDASSFTQHFRKRMGVSPAAYRKRS
jgi:AraC-like DNA-binding protein